MKNSLHESKSDSGALARRANGDRERNIIRSVEAA